MIDRLDRFFRPPCALVIDDEEGIRYALSRLLETSGYRVFTAPGGPEGIALHEQHRDQIALVICDFKMPELDGIATLTEIRKHDPDVLRVLLTGYATLEAAIEATNQGLDAFITKPYQVRELRAKLDELFGRKARAIAAETLGGVPLLRDVPQETLAQIFPSLERERAPRGTVLQDIGQPVEKLRIVREGEVSIEARLADGRLRPIAHLAPGEHFGELLGDGELSPVRAVASLDCELLSLQRDEFERLKGRFPQIGEAVARALTRRLSGIVNGQGRASLVLACKATGAAPHGALQLALALAQLGASVALLELRPGGPAPSGKADADLSLVRRDEGGVARYADAGERSRMLVAEHLPRIVASLRQRHRVVLLSLPEHGDEVSARATGQAHQLATFVEGVAHGLLRAEVTALEGAAGAPALSLHLEARDLASAGPGLRRVARRLLGASVGVALSAGNARGIAHLGVLRAIERGGVEIDHLAGCSMGSVVGSLYARGMTIDEIIEGMTRADLKRVATAGISLSRPPWEHTRAALVDALDGCTFEQARLPFVCNATDLGKGGMALFDSGPLAPAVCASFATPPHFPPFYIDGRAFADGGLINGLPADVLTRRGLDLVVAVDIMHKEPAWDAPPEPRGGWVGGVLAGMPVVLRYASMLGVIERAVGLSIRELIEARFTAAAVTIKPEFQATPLDWDVARWPPMIEAGERATEGALPEIKERQRALLAPWKA